MTIRIDITSKVLREKIRLELDPKQSPETIRFLKKTESEDFTPYELATKLAECDKTAVMSRVLFDYIVELYLEAIQDNNANAMNDLGALYYGGRGCIQDYSKAVYYYEKAAQLGNRQAQENLGYCYYYGRSVSVDYEKAFHYFALGAFDGRLISLYKIGDMYLNGYYVEKNPTEAFLIYDRCIGMMTDEAAPLVAGPVFLRLGNCYLNGIGIKENAKDALFCYQIAERYLFDMVAHGDVMYQKSLQDAIDGQAKAREKLFFSIPSGPLSHPSELRKNLSAKAFEKAFLKLIEQAKINAVTKRSNGSTVPYGFSGNNHFDGANLSQHFGYGAASKTPYINWWVVSIYYDVDNDIVVMGIEENRYANLDKMAPIKFKKIGNRSVRIAVFYESTVDSVDYEELCRKFIDVCETVMMLGLGDWKTFDLTK